MSKRKGPEQIQRRRISSSQICFGAGTFLLGNFTEAGILTASVDTHRERRPFTRIVADRCLHVETEAPLALGIGRASKRRQVEVELESLINLAVAVVVLAVELLGASVEDLGVMVVAVRRRRVAVVVCIDDTLTIKAHIITCAVVLTGARTIHVPHEVTAAPRPSVQACPVLIAAQTPGIALDLALENRRLSLLCSGDFEPVVMNSVVDRRIDTERSAERRDDHQDDD